jgi:carboxypeptidase Taq
MKSEQKEYENLHALSRHTKVLEGIAHLLDWDQETYMPSGSAAIRAEQLKTMAGFIEKK